LQSVGERAIRGVTMMLPSLAFGNGCLGRHTFEGGVQRGCPRCRALDADTRQTAVQVVSTPTPGPVQWADRVTTLSRQVQA